VSVLAYGNILNSIVVTYKDKENKVVMEKLEKQVPSVGSCNVSLSLSRDRGIGARAWK
jgi:hypothetical protein